MASGAATCVCLTRTGSTRTVCTSTTRSSSSTPTTRLYVLFSFADEFGAHAGTTDPPRRPHQLDREPRPQAPRVPWPYQHWQEVTSAIVQSVSGSGEADVFVRRTVVSARVTATTTPPAGRPGKSTTRFLCVATGKFSLCRSFLLSVALLCTPHVASYSLWYGIMPPCQPHEFIVRCRLSLSEAAAG